MVASCCQTARNASSADSGRYGASLRPPAEKPWSQPRHVWVQFAQRAATAIRGWTGAGNQAQSFTVKPSVHLKRALIAVSVLSITAFTPNARAGEPVYPLKVSENRRYFMDQKGDPVFWLGTTQWQLFRDYTLEEARMIIEKTKGHGFAFAQVMLLGVGDGTKPNVYGQKPWVNNDPLTPNEDYFKHVDAVVQIARENNLVISMTIFHQRWRNIITREKARDVGKVDRAPLQGCSQHRLVHDPRGQSGVCAGGSGIGGGPARRRRRLSPRDLQARSRAASGRISSR